MVKNQFTFLDKKLFKVNSAPDIVDALMDAALLENASDIHITPTSSFVRVRFRVDGILYDGINLPLTFHHAIISRFKILARLRSDLHTIPHDGRFFYEAMDGPLGGQRIDARISIVPTYYGENAVIRLLVARFLPKNLAELNFSERDQFEIMKALRKQQGLVVVAGPTGSGKTTTLYTIIRVLSSPDVSIVTIEDPVEYALEGSTQIHISPDKNISFASALRSVLRQDPDIIMLGEIRDGETAKIAVQAALTGHLVICTIHTYESSAVIPRLIDIGIDPYLIVCTLRLVISQRLVRGTFLSGRIGINEVMVVDEKIRTAIKNDIDADLIKDLAIQGGMTTLHQDGLRKAECGLTTEEEIVRVLSE